MISDSCSDGESDQIEVSRIPEEVHMYVIL